MLEYDWIDISGLMLIKQIYQKNMIFAVFKDIGFKYKKYLCNGSHDLMEKALSFKNIAIVYIKESAYRIHFWYMSKDDAIGIMNGSNLINKSGVLYFFFCFFYYI